MSLPSLQQIPVVQMGHVEKIAEVVQNQPQVQQQVTQGTARAQLKEEGGQVPRVTKDQAVEQLRTEADAHKRQQPDHQAGQKRGAKDDQPGESPEAPARGENPWAGHILNLKV